MSDGGPSALENVAGITTWGLRRRLLSIIARIVGI